MSLGSKQRGGVEYGDFYENLRDTNTKETNFSTGM